MSKLYKTCIKPVGFLRCNGHQGTVFKVLYESMTSSTDLLVSVAREKANKRGKKVTVYN